MGIAVVTGANRGIGCELVRQLVTRGTEVVAVCRHSSRELDALHVRVESGFDMTEPDVGSQLAARLGDCVVDLLVPNAGIMVPDSLGGAEPKDVRAQFEINALAPLFLTRALLPRMQTGAKVALISHSTASLWRFCTLARCAPTCPAGPAASTSTNPCAACCAASTSSRSKLRDASCTRTARCCPGDGGVHDFRCKVRAGHPRDPPAVDDFSRIGALRLADEQGHFLRSTDRHRTPQLLDLAQIAHSARRLEQGTESAQDLDDLMGKATSLGGMRPKCTVLEEDGGPLPRASSRLKGSRSPSSAALIGHPTVRASPTSPGARSSRPAATRTAPTPSLPIGSVRSARSR